MADYDCLDATEAPAPAEWQSTLVPMTAPDLAGSSAPTEWLAAIASATPAEGDAILEDFARAQQPELRKIATRIAMSYRLDRTTHGGDVLSLVNEAFLLVVKDVRDGTLTVDEITSFTGMVSYRAKSRVRVWVDSSAGMNTASRQVSLKRRINQMRQTRDQLLVEGVCDPTAEQVVEETNRRMRAHRKDAARQGMLCTVEDYQVMNSGPAVELRDLESRSDPHDERGTHGAAGYGEQVSCTPDPNDQDGVLHSAERDLLVKVTIERCYQVSESHGKVAEAFFGTDMAASFDRPPTSADIADIVGIAAPTVRRKIAEVKQVAQEVLKTYFGITGVDS